MITILSPTNDSYAGSSIWANATLSEAGSWCGRSLDGAANVTLDNTTGNWNNLMTSVSAATHNINFYCNDTAGNMNRTNVTFTRTASTTITLINGTMAFGDITLLQINNTIDFAPAPFVVQNDGDVGVDVTISATDLWSTQANPSMYYRYACNSTAEVACAAGSNTTARNIPAGSAPDLVIKNLPSADSTDTNEVEINITAPDEEPGGSKSSTVTFIATQTDA